MKEQITNVNNPPDFHYRISIHFSYLSLIQMEAELERLSKSNDEEKLKNEELRTKLNASALALQQEKQLVCYFSFPGLKLTVFFIET